MLSAQFSSVLVSPGPPAYSLLPDRPPFSRRARFFPSRLAGATVQPEKIPVPVSVGFKLGNCRATVRVRPLTGRLFADLACASAINRLSVCCMRCTATGWGRGGRGGPVWLPSCLGSQHDRRARVCPPRLVLDRPTVLHGTGTAPPPRPGRPPPYRSLVRLYRLLLLCGGSPLLYSESQRGVQFTHTEALGNPTGCFLTIHIHKNELNKKS